jgi:hypothetical protein
MCVRILYIRNTLREIPRYKTGTLSGSSVLENVIDILPTFVVRITKSLLNELVLILWLYIVTLCNQYHEVLSRVRV